MYITRLAHSHSHSTLSHHYSFQRSFQETPQNDKPQNDKTEQSRSSFSTFENSFNTVNAHDIPTTPRMKQMYSSLASDSDSSGLSFSIISSSSSDELSVSSTEEAVTTYHASASNSICRSSYYQSVNSSLRKAADPDVMTVVNPSKADIGGDSTCNSIQSIGCHNEEHTTRGARQSSVSTIATPPEEGDALSCRTSYYQSVQSPPRTRKPDELKSSKANVIQTETKIVTPPEGGDASSCRTSYYQSVESPPRTRKPDELKSSKASVIKNETKNEQKSVSNSKSKCINISSYYQSIQVTPEQISNEKKIEMKSRSQGSAFSNYTKHKKTISECKNPYYRSVQQLTSTSEESAAVIFGRPPVRNPDDQSRFKSKSNSNREHDDDQRTLLTASETATVVSCEASHWNLTDAGTIQSGCCNEYQSGLSSMPSSPTRSCGSDVVADSGGAIDAGLYKLCTPVRVRVNVIEGGSSSEGTRTRGPPRPLEVNSDQKPLKKEDSFEQESDHESTSESLASDKVVTSMILIGDEVESPNIPRKITFQSGQQSHYTSLKDLILPDDTLLKQLVEVASILPVRVHVSEGEDFIRRNDQFSDRGFAKRIESIVVGGDNCVSAELDSNCKENTPMTGDELNLTSPTLLKVTGSEEPEPFHVKNENDGSIVSPVKEVSHSYDDGESMLSSMIHIPNDIKIGTITNLDLFRKEKCEDDECNFSLFRKRDKAVECNLNCAIM